MRCSPASGFLLCVSCPKSAVRMTIKTSRGRLALSDRSQAAEKTTSDEKLRKDNASPKGGEIQTRRALKGRCRGYARRCDLLSDRTKKKDLFKAEVNNSFDTDSHQVMAGVKENADKCEPLSSFIDSSS